MGYQYIPRYVNMSKRVTTSVILTSVILNNDGLGESNIINIVGHKSIKSLTNYIHTAFKVNNTRWQTQLEIPFLKVIKPLLIIYLSSLVVVVVLQNFRYLLSWRIFKLFSDTHFQLMTIILRN